MTDTTTESQRLEALWNGEFGNAYVDRNLNAGNVREAFWNRILDNFPARRVLEVGCNVGANLTWIASRIPPQQVYGLEINLKALEILRKEFPGINSTWGVGRELPYRDQFFDMVFTMGVLIHQPDTTLPLIMSEIVRCSRRYIVCGEYYAAERTEVPYRGQTGALIKRDFGRLYQEMFPELQLRAQGFLGRDEGWDDVTYWVFEKPL